MKKLLSIICFTIISATGYAQINKGESAFVVQTGFKTETTRLLVGGNWRYALVDNLRFSGELNYLFPKHRTIGLNAEANLQYTISLDSFEEKMYAYPIIGASMINNRYMGEKKGGHTSSARGWTNWGFNIGGGYEYHVSNKVFINTEIKYILSKIDAFSWTVGLGFKY